MDIFRFALTLSVAVVADDRKILMVQLRAAPLNNTHAMRPSLLQFVDGVDATEVSNRTVVVSDQVVMRDSASEDWKSGFATSAQSILMLGNDKNSVHWGFKHAQVHSNLGGVGPHTGEQALRYMGIANFSGVVVDLVVTAITPYRAFTASKNGKTGKFGRINLKSSRGTETVTLQFNFYKRNTNHPAVFSNFYFTIYDMDQTDTSVLAVTFDNRVDKVFKVPNCELLESGNISSGLTFTSSVFGNGMKNPTDPDALTPLQKERTVTVTYSNKSWWRVTFSVTGGNKGRNILFAGRANIVPAISAPLPTSPQLHAEKLQAGKLLGATPTATNAGGEKSVVPGACIIWGEYVHIITFDLHHKHLLQHPRQEAFFRTRDNQAKHIGMDDEGFFWLVKSSYLHIQGFFTKNKTHPTFNYLSTIAIGGPLLDTNILVIRPLGDNITWNERDILPFSPSEFVNEYVTAQYHNNSELVKDGGTGVGIDISLPKGVILTVNRWKRNLGVKITMRKEEGQDGLCGNFNGDPNDDILRELHPKLAPQEFLAQRYNRPREP